MIVVQGRAYPAAIRNAIVDLIPANLNEIIVASAYVTRGGCDLLLDAVYNAVGQAVFEEIPKTLLTSIDYGLTEPAALRLWSELPNSGIYVSGLDMLQRRTLMPQRAFHPKIYSFGCDDSETYNTLVGSANLTGRGLSVNSEVAYAQWGVPRIEVDSAFSAILSETTALSLGLLADYERLRRVVPPPPEIALEVEPLAPPRVAGGGSLPLFRLAIESGRVDPSVFSAMWVQGEALQGGSRNQLELPRGAHRFFGFNFDQYEFAHNAIIGMPLLWSGQRVWRDRPLTWHGNNRMERINLPTRNHGGFDYTNTVVMFRRVLDGSFELIVTPWDSELASSWVSASESRGTLFRLGMIATNRVVGLI
ncbi:phospholipase D family protein [Pseudomonas aeruginosa]|uniref:phospholipase D family protein n=1 Tax=Pseudomonas aeruginosa TaxID=287 RepID=UPI0008FB6531|nr:phospholipase D family protein [Pseudomonas aeruginosa]EIU7205263.1 hypothetical protein [Pseudomonas aeruginosa]MBF1860012.1 NgoFVII family restriction endonuclease [Pseudomonas aeruginosa]MBW6156845.1 phospholipase D family protein [Pseudomonas aeruginosa]MCO2581416.1 NgoFVII family restriction endonuclease [Pseudomonas aeruginosa]MCO2953194.1 NgoFVII family restriction endonuclease [Pseudomonas aeruginosa]